MNQNIQYMNFPLIYADFVRIRKFPLDEIVSPDTTLILQETCLNFHDVRMLL